MNDEGLADNYIRGGGGVAVDSRRLASIVLVVSVAVLLVLVVLLTLDAVAQQSRTSRLTARGVAVEVTVTGCLGSASGSGITEAGFVCRGTFALDGHRYNAVIRGSAVLHQPGDRVRALALPGDPASLSTEASVRAPHKRWTPFVTPAVLLLLAVSAVVGWLAMRRRPTACASARATWRCRTIPQ